MPKKITGPNDTETHEVYLYMRVNNISTNGVCSFKFSIIVITCFLYKIN